MCSAAQQGDEMACGRCGLRWGVADVDRPQCLLHERRIRPRDNGLPPMPTRPLVQMGRRLTLVASDHLEKSAARVDYRELLLKYMRHMLAEEGRTGADWIGIDGRGYFSGVMFSAEEVAALKVCAGELAVG